MLERASFTDAFNTIALGIGLWPASPTRPTATPCRPACSRRRSMTPTSSARAGSGARHLFAAGRVGLPPPWRQLSSPRSEQSRNACAAVVHQRSARRPLTQITDQRFVDTGNIASRGDDSVGVEVGGVFKSFHFAAEAQKTVGPPRLPPDRRAQRSGQQRHDPSGALKFPTAIPPSRAPMAKSAIISPGKAAATRAASGIAPRCSSRSTRADGARSSSTPGLIISTSTTGSGRRPPI